MMASRKEWAKAFAKQARADLRSHNEMKILENVPDCHRLQFLQMACEKIAKAHLCQAGSDPKVLEQSHVYIASALPTIVREQYTRTHGKSLKNRSDLTSRISHLARQIELLSPSARDAGRRPDNCEYPWEDAAGNIHIPAEFTFPNLLTQLSEAAGILLLKLLPNAIDELASSE
jgi:hypothetical protein